MATAGEIPQVDPTTLRARLERGGPIALLDVRRDDERALARIGVGDGVPDLHVPMDRVAARLAEIRSAAEGRSLVVYCHHGVRSEAVAHWLLDRGLAGVENLRGGIDRWSIEVDQGVPRY